jgi:hypothetical protein
MKKVSFIIALFAVIVGGCTKNYYRDNDATKPSYRVDGIRDFSISEDNPQYSMVLELVYMNKEQENVSVSVEGLPQGMYAEVLGGSGIPSFTANVNFYDSSAVPGTYQAKVVTTGSVTGKKSFIVNITVQPIVDCRNDLAGVYSGQSFCAASGMYTASVSVSPTVSKRILIDNFENSGFQVYASVICGQNSINLPSQMVNGVVYSGSGYYYTNTFGNRTLYLSYNKLFANGGTTSCNVNFTN